VGSSVVVEFCGKGGSLDFARGNEVSSKITCMDVMIL
jgi:hypothetical protein